MSERESNNLFHVRKYVQNGIENVIFIVIERGKKSQNKMKKKRQMKSDIKIESSGEIKKVKEKLWLEVVERNEKQVSN